MKRTLQSLAAGMFLFLAIPSAAQAQKVKVQNLQTEYKTNPIGIGTTSPRFSWEIIAENQRGIYQTAYQLVCATNLNDLNNANYLWDSGMQESSESVHVKYEGRALQSGERIFWKVRVKTNNAGQSKWSNSASFQVGLLSQNEWKAKWISSGVDENVQLSTPTPYLRKEFELKKQIARATAYVSARGLYELNLNGEKVGDQFFTPGWTSYDKRLQYQVFDVTNQLHQGNNAIGAMLGDGWYRSYFGWEGKKNLYGDKTALICQIKIDYTDGSTEYIITDESWKSNTGAFLESDIYNGEKYDARKEMNNWSNIDFDDSNWKNVITQAFDYSNLVPSDGEPVKITQRLKPLRIITTPKGERVIDFGQNLVGWVHFKLQGKAGEKIILNHGEVLDAEGNFYDANLRLAKAQDEYTFKGDGVEEYMPKFTFHGFQFVKVSGYSGELHLEDFEACVVHSAMKQIGSFHCSDTLLNQLQSNIQWSVIDNTLDVPTDCPQRDERMGWTGDAQVIAPTMNFNFQTASFWAKWLQDLAADQKADGSIPWVSPNVVPNGAGTGWSDGFGSTAWGDAAVIIPWSVYQAYGDINILQQQYQSMKAWEEYMIEGSGDNYIFSKGFHFGDWLSFAEYFTYNYNAPDYGYAGANTDKELIATAYFYYTTSLMLETAQLLGKTADAERYADLLPKIKDAFNEEFITPTGRTVSGTQTSYILPLCFGILKHEMVEIIAQRLADDVNYFGHLTTGFVGTPLICKALSDYGHADVAYKLLFNKRYPSWLYPITKGATTIWERWDCIKPDGSFQTTGMNSFNHYAYGAVGLWLYENVAGLKNVSAGYKHFEVNPILSDSLSFAQASHHSIYGEIMVKWERKNGTFILHVHVPVNTSASIFLPTSKEKQVTESGKPLHKAEGIMMALPSGENEPIMLEVGSGKYNFVVDYLSNK